MRIIQVVVICCVLCVTSAFAQTVADLEAKFGKPTEVYSVSEHIWIIPEYTADGQICQLELFPKRTDRTTNYLSHHLPFEELTIVLNSLVPVDQRGRKQQYFGNTTTGGPAAWTTYGYERVTFIFVSSFKSRGSDDSPPLRRGDFKFPEISVSDQPLETGAADNDFRFSQRSEIDIVTIKWNERKCRLN